MLLFWHLSTSSILAHTHTHTHTHTYTHTHTHLMLTLARAGCVVFSIAQVHVEWLPPQDHTPLHAYHSLVQHLPSFPEGPVPCSMLKVPGLLLSEEAWGGGKSQVIHRTESQLYCMANSCLWLGALHIWSIHAYGCTPFSGRMDIVGLCSALPFPKALCLITEVVQKVRSHLPHIYLPILEDTQKSLLLLDACVCALRLCMCMCVCRVVGSKFDVVW